MKRALIIVLMALLAPAPAVADWQFTRWGMTAEQVVAVSGGSLRPATAAEQRSLRRRPDLNVAVVGPYSAAGIPFNADLSFDAAGRLALVALKLADWERRAAFRDAIIGTYGAPADIDGGASGSNETWRDARGGNLVRLYTLPGIRSMTVFYSPLASGL